MCAFHSMALVLQRVILSAQPFPRLFISGFIQLGKGSSQRVHLFDMTEVELGVKVQTLTSVMTIEKTVVITTTSCWMTTVIFYCR